VADIKNHIKVEGKLLQTNKKWSALKQKQRDWIYEHIRIKYDDYVEINEQLPMKKRKDTIIDAVYKKIEEREIWIPYDEYHSHASVFIDRLNRKAPLFNPPVKKDKPPKPILPKEGLEGFSQEVQDAVKEKMSKCIKSYISQAKRIPPNKRRDADITIVVRFCNSRYGSKHGKHLIKDNVLLMFYDDLRIKIFAEMNENGQLQKKK